MTQQNEVQQRSPEELEDLNDTLRNVLAMKENTITQLQADIVTIQKAANKRIAELEETLATEKKKNEITELNGVGELIEG